MAKWLDKYEQGGMVLKQKTHDNYGKKANPNDVQASVGPGFVGLGYNTKGRNYSPAWGGQFQNGGFLQPNSSKLLEGYVIPYNTPSTELAMSIGGEEGEPAYLIPSFKGGKKLKDPITEYKKTGEHLGGPFKTWQEAEKFGEMRHQYVEKRQSLPSPYKFWGDMAMGGALPGAVGFMYARTQNPAPSNGPYAKKTKASAQNGQEMKFYQEGLDFKPKTISKNGSIIKDDRGQWAHPGEITQINSNNITMQGVDYPVLGISDTGHTQMMQPDQDYKFDGEKVTEYPMAQDGWLSKSIDAVGNVMSAPARGLTYLATGKYQDPSEALGITNPYAKFATDAILDPINLVGGVGLFNDARKIGKEAKLIEEASKVKKAAEPLATSRLRSMEEVREYNKNLVKPGADFKTGATKAPPKGMEPIYYEDKKNGGWLNKYK